MKSFDIIFFMLAVLGTVGMMGLGVALAQLSLTILFVSLLLLGGSLFIGFRRKHKLYATSINES
ncbi:DUF5325 family protein [Alkalicoccus daliensis]|uniref:Uncharacterized protein n=1 Tax=Alkalicoccus daliensis TaxID=745820 RepID=A0A1G9ZRS8_9BACI|nr:DUF5325 family protein [Alkalicoccus daliensis]SDN23807.1 hypothetical protein SAMN04488053_101210 [Alkalicoccus daliensis]